MRALRFQIRGRHQTSMASPGGKCEQSMKNTDKEAIYTSLRFQTGGRHPTSRPPFGGNVNSPRKTQRPFTLQKFLNWAWAGNGIQYCIYTWPTPDRCRPQSALLHSRAECTAHVPLHVICCVCNCGSPWAHLHVVGTSWFMSGINQPSLPTPAYSVLVSISVFMALSTVFRSINSRDNSPFSQAVLVVLTLPYWSSQIYLSLWKSPAALI